MIILAQFFRKDPTLFPYVVKYFDSKHVYDSTCNKLHLNQSYQGLGVYVDPPDFRWVIAQEYYTFTSSEVGTSGNIINYTQLDRYGQC